MKFHPAAYALLLLSSRAIDPVNGELRPAIVPKIQPASDGEGNTRHVRQLHKSKKSKDTSGEGIVSTLEYACHSRDNKDDCNTDGCVWIDEHCIDDPPKCGSFAKQKSCETSKLVQGCLWQNEACIDTDTSQDEEAPTVWPTYSPSVPSTRSPAKIAPPPLVTHEFDIDSPTPQVGCDPIGSRTTLTGPTIPRPTRNNPITRFPTSPPSGSPTLLPSGSPTSLPTGSPVRKKVPEGPSPVTFRRGDLRKDIDRFGFKVSKGMLVRQVAVANRSITLANGKQSKLPFHSSPDGAAVLSLSDGGYVYVNNSEVIEGNGGVSGIYFDSAGNVVDYKRLLSGTTRNCSGGTTPWNTFVSCEEYGRGQCWQVDPDPSGDHHSKPEMTQLGGSGGNYEAVACDDRKPSQPIFFVAEDHEKGALRRYTPPPAIPGTVPGWDTLHVEGGNTEYLFFLDDERFTWTCDESLGRLSAQTHFPNVEGINFKGGLLYFVSKRTFNLYVLDLDNGTYKTSSTDEYELYDGEFRHSPDQLARTNAGNYLYFTEDGGRTAGVYCIDAEGRSYSIFEAYDPKYFGDETTGLAFSPDGKRMFASFQDCGCETSGDIDCGCLFEFRRDDGRSFDGDTLSLKFHSNEDRM